MFHLQYYLLTTVIHIQSLCNHVCEYTLVLHNTVPLEVKRNKKWDSSECCVPRKSFWVSFWACMTDWSAWYSHTRKNIIKMDVKKILWEGMDWIDFGHDREKWWAVLKAATVLWVSQNVGNFLTGWWTSSFTGEVLNCMGLSGTINT